jgi:putative flippase GtrA
MLAMIPRVLVRHQVGAMIATAVDFTVMIAVVSGAGAAPSVGTACGAACGGVANFLVSRNWVFRATRHKPVPQAGRYAAVSLASLLLNTVAMHGIADLLHFPYVAARMAVALAVSLLWNFPMHRTFVFGENAK